MDISAIVSDMQAKAASASPLGSTLKFKMGDACIFIDGNNGNAVSTDDKEADCTIKCTLETFQGMMDGTIEPAMAFMVGKLKVEGSAGLAMKLSSIIED